MKKNNPDAYGNYLWGYHFLGERIPEIVERSDKYISAGSSFEDGYGGGIYFSEYKDWPEYEKEASKYVTGKVLDIGCGAGRYALHFQKLGHAVLAVDVSALSIKVSQDRGVKQTKVMTISDIHKIKSQKFDTILMMGNNFGLFGSFTKAQTLLRKMYKITSKDARIIADATDPILLDQDIDKKYKSNNLKKGRMPGQLKMRVRYKNLIDPWINYLLASKNEIKEIVKTTGWEVEKFIDSDEKGIFAVLLKKSHIDRKS